MTSPQRILATLCIAAATLGTGSAALAQSTSTTSPSNSLYGGGNSYVGVGVGRSDYSLGNGTGVFGSEKRDTSYNFSTGSYFDRNFGVELGYTNFGNIARGGGQTKAEGINLSAVGRIPLSTSFNLLGKLGTTYGRTRVSSAAGSGIASGSESGFGLSLGLGAEYVFTTQLSAVLQYELHDLKFAGSGRDHVGNTTIGMRYRF